MKNLKLFTLIAIMLTVMVSCGGSKKNETPGQALVTIQDYLGKKQFKEFINRVVHEDGSKLTEEEKNKMEQVFPLITAEIDEKGKYKKTEVIEEIIDADGVNARVIHKVHLENGDAEETEASLKKIDGVWYLIMS